MASYLQKTGVLSNLTHFRFGNQNHTHHRKRIIFLSNLSFREHLTKSTLAIYSIGTTKYFFMDLFGAFSLNIFLQVAGFLRKQIFKKTNLIFNTIFYI